MRRDAHSLLEELAIPILFLSLGALLVLTSLAGGHVTERGGGFGVIALAFGAWTLVQAWHASRRR